MTKIAHDSKLFFYGFPITLLGYKDDKWGYNITTNSSSYSLGEMLVLGLGSKSNAARQIQKYGQFTINIPQKENLDDIEMAGFNSHKNKLNLTHLLYQIGDCVDAPILKDLPISLECQVCDIIPVADQVVNVIALIKKRWFTTDLLDKDHLKTEKINPVYFMGDEHKRLYRFLDSEFKETEYSLKHSQE